METNLEDIFLNDLRKNDRGIVSIGMPETGKSYTMLKYIVFATNINLYENIYMFLPNFKNEQNKSYDFLMEYENIFIYDKFDDRILGDLIEKCKQSNGRNCIVIDDGTGKMQFHNQNNLLALITTTRHAKITLWMLLHASSGQISPAIRQNVKFLFLNNFENQKTFKSQLFEEFTSMYTTYDEFKSEYLRSMETAYGQVLIARNCKLDPGQGPKTYIDYKVVTWNLLNEKIQLKKSVKKSVKKPVEKPVEKQNNVNLLHLSIWDRLNLS